MNKKVTVGCHIYDLALLAKFLPRENFGFYRKITARKSNAKLSVESKVESMGPRTFIRM